MIKRKKIQDNITEALNRGRIVSILGPRQCGKTTLARQFAEPGSSSYFDLEDPIDNAKLAEAQNALQNLKGTVVIDEVQRQPELFPLLRVLADRIPLPAKFLILGSASPSLIKQASESLAGRVERIRIGGFSLEEVGQKNVEQLWLRGGLPCSFLADSDKDAFIWLKEYIQSFVERDLPLHGVSLPSVTLIRFWTMLAHYHGQIFNASEIARSLGISIMTVNRYLDIMTGVFMIRQLQPWHANIKKRQVKAPKIYFNDTGILHALLGIQNRSDLLRHPKYGASWEGFVLEEVIRAVEPHEVFFWATHQGAEIDLVFNKGGQMYGVEIKRQDAPRMTPSIKHALEDLKLEGIAVIYPGQRRYSIHKQVDVVPFDEIQGGMKGLFGGKA
ncbi:MAG TPA: ATP-binding protein [Candidatus Omnitrophota bacterium]|nr:ATP-binding protein [Candidatus Omnitrophota bacterium]